MLDVSWPGKPAPPPSARSCVQLLDLRLTRPRVLLGRWFAREHPGHSLHCLALPPAHHPRVDAVLGSQSRRHPARHASLPTPPSPWTSLKTASASPSSDPPFSEWIELIHLSDVRAPPQPALPTG